MSFYTFVSLIALAIVSVVVFDFVRAYLKSTATGWQRIWDAGRGSATVVIGQLGMVASMLAVSFDKVVDWICSLLQDPSAADQIKTLIGQYVTATNVGLVMAAFTGLVVAARLRTLGQ
jgi:hypothetical protein